MMSRPWSNADPPLTSRIIHQVVESGWLILVLCCVYGVAMSVAAPGFASLANAHNVWIAMLPLLIVATGQTLVLISGGIDLSVTSIIAMASVASALVATGDEGLLSGSVLATPVALLTAFFVGGLVGALNGVCVAWIRMPPFIVTLTSMMAVSGIAVWWTQSKSIYQLPESFLFFGRSLWVSTAVALGLAAFVQWGLTKGLFGMRLRAVGYNPSAAHVSGVPVGRTIFQVYLASGLCAGIAAILITGQLETGSPVQWENNLLDVIGATVIGGTSLYGGRGSVVWTAGGVLLLVLIDNSLNLLNLSHFSIMMVKGAIILSAALLDSLRHRASGDSGP